MQEFISDYLELRKDDIDCKEKLATHFSSSSENNIIFNDAWINTQKYHSLFTNNDDNIHTPLEFSKTLIKSLISEKPILADSHHEIEQTIQYILNNNNQSTGNNITADKLKACTSLLSTLDLYNNTVSNQWQSIYTSPTNDTTKLYHTTQLYLYTRFISNRLISYTNKISPSKQDVYYPFSSSSLWQLKYAGALENKPLPDDRLMPGLYILSSDRFSALPVNAYECSISSTNPSAWVVYDTLIKVSLDHSIYVLFSL